MPSGPGESCFCRHLQAPAHTSTRLCPRLVRQQSRTCDHHCPQAAAGGRDQSHGQLGKNLCLLSACASAGSSRGPRSRRAVSRSGMPLPEPANTSWNLTVRSETTGRAGPRTACWGSSFRNTSGRVRCGESKPESGSHGPQAESHPSERAVGRGAWEIPDSGGGCRLGGPSPCGSLVWRHSLWPPPGQALPTGSWAPQDTPAGVSSAGTETRPRILLPGMVPVESLAVKPSIPGCPWWLGSCRAAPVPCSASQDPASALHTTGPAPRPSSLMLCLCSAELGRAGSAGQSVGGAFSGSQCGPAGGR